MRIERSLNMFPERVRVYVNEENFKRQMIDAYCYPKYDKQIRVKANCIGLGFTLELEDAENLVKALEVMIKELK